MWAALLLLFVFAGLAFAADQDGLLTVKAPGATPHLPVGNYDRIWSGVIMATDSPTPKEPPAELREFASRLRRVFGYNQFELIGSATEEIDELTENWLVPSPLFSLSVRARRATSKEARGGYLLNLQLFQEKKPLVDTEAKLAPGSPLFIRGPQYGKGELIIVLQVQH